MFPKNTCTLIYNTITSGFCTLSHITVRLSIGSYGKIRQSTRHKKYCRHHRNKHTFRAFHRILPFRAEFLRCFTGLQAFMYLRNAVPARDVFLLQSVFLRRTTRAVYRFFQEICRYHTAALRVSLRWICTNAIHLCEFSIPYARTSVNGICAYSCISALFTSHFHSICSMRRVFSMQLFLVSHIMSGS